MTFVVRAYNLKFSEKKLWTITKTFAQSAGGQRVALETRRN